MFSHLSPKHGTDEIGRFGLGFKSVLAVSDAPEFYSRAGSFKFDREWSERTIDERVPNNDSERLPILRLAIPIDSLAYAENDQILSELMSWATNIVRLSLVIDGHLRLSDQATDFPKEFLLFVQHVNQLEIQVDASEKIRSFSLREIDGEYRLHDQESETRWKVFRRMHRLSDDARADSRTLDDASEVPIWWAAPIEGSRQNRSFWAFFPTETPNLVPGIINAPWKTNEDRKNLLTGTFNDELVKASAKLVADNLHHLSSADNPAKHIDALPALPQGTGGFDRRHTVALSKHLFSLLYGRALFPDKTGELRTSDSLRFPQML